MIAPLEAEPILYRLTVLDLERVILSALTPQPAREMNYADGTYCQSAGDKQRQSGCAAAEWAHGNEKSGEGGYSEVRGQDIESDRQTV